MPNPILMSVPAIDQSGGLPTPLARLPEQWGSFVRSTGHPEYRGNQIFHWLHKQGVTEPSQMKNLPLGLRRVLEEEIGSSLSIHQNLLAPDGTRKLLLSASDGSLTETVLIPALKEDADSQTISTPVTQCLSTQIGCAMGCTFCASGVAGLKRHLSADEIIEQVLIARTAAQSHQYLRNLVFMGMGEPLHNYSAVRDSLRVLFHQEGMDFSKRRVTVSTSGLIPEIKKLGEDFGGDVQLAISLHAVDDAARSALMPINKKYPIADLVKALKEYPLPKRRRITIEYTLVDGANDSDADARELSRLLATFPSKVNLIPMNPVEKSPNEPPSHERVLRFQKILRDRGTSAYIRRQRGNPIDAACGQLAIRNQDGTKAKRTRRLPVTGSNPKNPR